MGFHSFDGLRIVQSDLVPPGELYVFSPEAFRAAAPEFVTYGITNPDWNRQAAMVRYEMRMAFAARRTRVETDPRTWGRPRGWRDLLRRMRAIIGYEFRKAADCQRRYADPGSVVQITGLAS